MGGLCALGVEEKGFLCAFEESEEGVCGGGFLGLCGGEG